MRNTSTIVFYDPTFMGVSGEATTNYGFNDIITNSIQFSPEAIDFTLLATETSVSIPYALYRDKVWIRLGLKKDQEVRITLTESSSSQPDPRATFLLYDDFSQEDSNTWIYQNSHISSGVLIVNGGNNVYGAYTKFDLPSDIVIEWSMFSNQNDFDSGIRIGPLYCISDVGTGTHAIYLNGFGYPNGSHQANTWMDYQVVVRDNEATFTNLSNGKSVTRGDFTYNPSPLQFICDSDTSANPLKVDYVCVRKYYDPNHIQITTSQIDNGKYEVVIKSSENYPDIQIPLDDIPATNYSVETKIISPTMQCKALPAGKTTFLTFFTQFTHSAKIGSKHRFHVHTFIPPDAQPGKVKLKLEWKTLPVEVVSFGSEMMKLADFVVNPNTIIKEFEITPYMIGRHTLLNFGEIDYVYSLSQIIFHRLTRLGTEDSFNYELPILYVDHHVIQDAFGSREEFIK